MLDEACREGQKALRVPDLLTATTAARVSCLMIDVDRQTPKAQLKDRLKRACGYEVCSDEDSNSVNSYGQHTAQQSSPTTDIPARDDAR